MTNSEQKTAIEAISENVVKTRFEDFDKDTVEITKNRIIDILGCAIGGANAGGNAAMLDLIRGWGGKKEATIWVHGGKAPAHSVAMLNAVICRSYDYEELGGSHQSGTTIPTAFAMAETAGAGGKEMLTALIAGNDVGYRVARAFDFDFFQGPDGIGTIQVFPATAITGKLLGLNAFQMRNAFGIVLTQTSGAIQDIWDGATTFKLPQGIAARNGITSAELAKGGWIGVKDGLLAKYGYYTMYTHGCTRPEALTKDLGKKYYSDTMFKRFPCGGPNHIAIDTALRMRSQFNIKAEDIESVTIGVNRHAMRNYYAKPFALRDFPHGDAVFSYRYTTASALLRGHTNLYDMTEEAIRDPKVNALIARIDVVELPEAMTKGKVRPAKVDIKMKDGREFSRFDDMPDSPLLSKPMTREELIAKVMEQVEFSKTVSQKNAEKLVKLVLKLEEVDDVSKLTRLMVGGKGR